MNVKKELRTKLRTLLASIGPEQRHARSTQACRLLMEQPEYQRAEVIMLFLSLPSEVETTSLVLQAWRTASASSPRGSLGISGG